MFKKLSLAAALAASLVLPATMLLPDAAEAGAHNKSANRSGNVNRNVHRGGSERMIVGKKYHGGTWYGHGRHFWRGRWYDYGVGECWQPSPIGFVWICG